MNKSASSKGPEEQLDPNPHGGLNIIAYFVRHGETTANNQGRFRGATDYPLNEKGFVDARRLAAYFKDKPLGDAWSSDLKRAETTAGIVLDPRGIDYEPDEDLRSLNIGNLAGELKKYHKDDMDYFERNPEVVMPGGESINQFRSRVKTPVLRAIHKGIINKLPSIVFTHSSIIHEVNNIIHHDHNANLVKPGGVVGVEHTSGNSFRVHALLKPHREDATESYSS